MSLDPVKRKDAYAYIGRIDYIIRVFKKQAFFNQFSGIYRYFKHFKGYIRYILEKTIKFNIPIKIRAILKNSGKLLCFFLKIF